MILSFLFGFLIAGSIATAAYKMRMLSLSGALTACALGTVVYGFGEWAWTTVLLSFFVSSSLLSKIGRRKKQRYDEKFSKGSQRDGLQVLANGGIAGVFAVLHGFFPLAAWPWVGFCAAFAAANADTWATELGVLSAEKPRLIFSGRKCEAGTSGAISRLGVCAAWCGAAFIALLIFFFPAQNGTLPLWGSFLAVTVGGFGGSLGDSTLGRFVQAIFWCRRCKKETERHPRHTCGESTRFLRGITWFNNDWVNFCATLFGALTAVAISVLFL